MYSLGPIFPLAQAVSARLEERYPVGEIDEPLCTAWGEELKLSHRA